MPIKDLGQLRRSAAVATFGPGAVVDFRADKATISAVAAGLEEWDRNFPPAGMVNEQTIHEERLEKKLGKKGFRLPPIRDPQKEKDENKALVAVRFPSWLQCPECDLIGRHDEWEEEPGKAGRYCVDCTHKAPGRRKIYTVPVRFVTACESGHLDEFPWHMWVDHEPGCKKKGRGFLRLRSEQAGLAGLILSCPECGARKSMDGIFSAKERMPVCRGHRPWLAEADEPCNHHVRALQRGASNLYFPVVESAISIPPWSDRLKESIGMAWELIVGVLPEDRPKQIEILSRTVLEPVLRELGLSPEQFRAEVERRLSAESAINTDHLRLEEYRQFTGGTYIRGIDREFEVRPQEVPDVLQGLFGRLVKATRLREVRAMTGFTRIHPPGEGISTVAQLSRTPLEWLPGIEVRGEGVFLEFADETLHEWENRQAVRERVGVINDRWVQEWVAHHGTGSTPPRIITPRFVLIHTFAHALMRQLTLDCGYSSTSLRERLYVDDGNDPMAGVLIYTATTDDDGTLGGLQRQGDPDRIGRSVQAAIAAQEWCSSDPLCIEDMLSPEDGLSLAACHSCVLTAETSCEEFNRFLDRGLLVGTPDHPEVGYFRSLLGVDES